MWMETDLARFLKEKRQAIGFTVREMAEKSGISAGHYSDFESGRRKPAIRETLDSMSASLNLSEKDKLRLYDLAAKVRSEAPTDLPGYINEHEKVRYALRLAKDSGNTQVWDKFIDFLEYEKGKGGTHDD